jgi:hypothetical protein
MSRQWVPSDYIDEISPPPRATPGAWVTSLPGDAYALAPADDLDEATPRVLHDNDTVPFHWTEHFGRATLTSGADRIWSVDRPPPPETTHICALGDPETLAYGRNGAAALVAFIKQWIENDPDPGQRVTLTYYTWSDEPVNFLFHAGAFSEIKGAATAREDKGRLVPPHGSGP